MNEFIVPTGVVIKEYLDECGITQKDLSRRIDVSERHLSKMLNGKTRLTEDMAIKLEKVITDIPASYWLNYEMKYRENLAREKERAGLDSVDLNEVAKRYHFKEVFAESALTLVDQAISMLKFLGISDFDQFNRAYPKVAVEFMQDDGEPEAVIIWLKLCEADVKEQNPDLSDVPYSEQGLRNSLGTLKAISTNINVEASLKSCGKLLNRVGIYFVVEPAITNSKVRGALTTYEGHPAIYVSGRFKTHDHIWFTILHELAHLLLHYKANDAIISMEELVSDQNKDLEANEYARSFFIDSDDYMRFKEKGDFEERNIRQFAAQEGISPDIVVGFLQHDLSIAPSQLNYLRTRL